MHSLIYVERFVEYSLNPHNAKNSTKIINKNFVMCHLTHTDLMNSYKYSPISFRFFDNSFGVIRCMVERMMTLNKQNTIATMVLITESRTNKLYVNQYAPIKLTGARNIVNMVAEINARLSLLFMPNTRSIERPNAKTIPQRAMIPKIDNTVIHQYAE